MTDEIEVEVPGFKFSPEEIAAIKADLQLPESEVSEEVESAPIEQPIKRKRGRPRKHPLPEGSEDKGSGTTPLISPAPLNKRDEKEVSTRLQSMLKGGTGIAGNVKPYLEMTDEEAKAIADPLSSYLVRNADTIPVARQVLENYDLLAIMFGVMAYVARVYSDRSAELANQRKEAGPGGKALARMEQLTTPSPNGSEIRQGSFVSSPYGTGDGIDPNV